MILVPYLILFGCLLVELTYLRTKQYDSKKGVLLFVAGMVLLLARTLFLKTPTTLIFDYFTFWQSGALNGVFTLAIIIFFLIWKTKKKIVGFGLKYGLILFLFYLPWGFLQQLFFQYIFLETVFFLTKNKILTLIASSIFYTSVHSLKIDKRLTFLCFFASLAWFSAYLNYGNIIWPSLSHAIFGVLYYSLISKKDVLRTHLGFISKYLKAKPLSSG